MCRFSLRIAALGDVSFVWSGQRHVSIGGALLGFTAARIAAPGVWPFSSNFLRGDVSLAGLWLFPRGVTSQEFGEFDSFG